MHNVRSLLWVFLFLPAIASASVLESVPSGKDLEGVKLTREAKLTIAGHTQGLYSFGAGLRSKKVAFFKAKVYVAELLVSEPSKLPRLASEALAAIAQQKAVVMRLTFLRNVSAEKLEDALREGFKLNKVNVDAAPFKALLEAVLAGGEVKEGKSILFIGEQLAGGKSLISFENAAEKLTSLEGEGASVRSLFSAWLGEAPDSGLEKLRGEIFSAP